MIDCFTMLLKISDNNHYNNDICAEISAEHDYRQMHMKWPPVRDV